MLDLVGAQSTIGLGVASLRKGGEIVVVGLYGGELKLPLVYFPLRGMGIRGSYVGSLPELKELVGLAQIGFAQAHQDHPPQAARGECRPIRPEGRQGGGPRRAGALAELLAVILPLPARGERVGVRGSDKFRSKLLPLTLSLSP